MADHDPVPEADALEQALPANDADPELIGVDDDPEIDFEVPRRGLRLRVRAPNGATCRASSS